MCFWIDCGTTFDPPDPWFLCSRLGAVRIFKKNTWSKNRSTMKPINLENGGCLPPKILLKTFPKIIKKFIDFLVDFEVHFGIILDANIAWKSYQKYHRFGDWFWMGFGSQNELQMASKSKENKLWSPPFRSPKRFENTASFFDRFGRPLGAIWTPPGLPFHTFSRPLGHRMALFSPSWAHFGNLQPSRTTKKNPHASRDENPPRSHRKSAENLPRTVKNPPKFCRDSAENQPRTRRTNPRQR